MGIFEVGIWCFLLILGQMSIFEVGIFVDRWCGYSRRISTDPTGPFSRSRQIAGSRRRTPALSPYTVYNIRKKKKMKNKRTDQYLFFSCIFFFFKKKNPDFGNVSKE